MAYQYTAPGHEARPTTPPTKTPAERLDILAETVAEHRAYAADMLAEGDLDQVAVALADIARATLQIQALVAEIAAA